MHEPTRPHLQAESREPSLPGRVPFGIARGPGHRIEVVFALRQGGVLAVNHNLEEAVSAESLDRFCAELREAISAGKDWRSFSDAWDATGQRAYVSMADVVGFTVRPAR
jgi:hypothetical protein